MVMFVIIISDVFSGEIIPILYKFTQITEKEGKWPYLQVYLATKPKLGRTYKGK